MNEEINKAAATNIPLSPEEAYLASQLFGKGLFSALQLARERESQKAQSEHFAGSDDVLRIPIPKNLMPSAKTAAMYGEPSYVGLGGERNIEPELTEGKGALSHVRRNIGKYLGGYGGGAIGAAMGAGRRLPHNTFDAVRKGGKGMLLGSLVGTGLGELYDRYNESQEMEKMRNEGTDKRQLIRRMMASGELENILNNQPMKMASDQYGDLGVVGRALNTQNSPVRLLAGGQQGFHEARRGYFMKQRENIQKELQDAQKEYIELLSKIKTAELSEDSTPCVDSFCNGIAYATLFGKKASDEDVEISDGAVSRLIGDLIGSAKRPFQPAIDTATGGLLNTGVGAAYLTHQLRKELRNKAHDYTAERLPTKVELQPYN